jgi:hypothetical protein
MQGVNVWCMERQGTGTRYDGQRCVVHAGSTCRVRYVLLGTIKLRK